MIRTYSIDREEDTIRLAESLAPLLKRGDLLALYGDLGTGKTFFTRHLCQALGVVEPVTSPSFVLVNEYEARQFVIYHVDLYRLKSESEVWGLGIDELIEDGITIVEWPHLTERLFTDRTLILTFRYTSKERSLTIEADESILKKIDRSTTAI